MEVLALEWKGERGWGYGACWNTQVRGAVVVGGHVGIHMLRELVWMVAEALAAQM